MSGPYCFQNALDVPRMLALPTFEDEFLSFVKVFYKVVQQAILTDGVSIQEPTRQGCTWLCLAPCASHL